MLGVKDAQRSIAFYRHKLGRAVKSAFEGFVFLDGGGVTQCLSEALAKNSPSLVGATEVVFSVADVPAAYDALRVLGVEFSHAPRVVSGPMWAANFRYPDGHGLSIFGPEHADLELVTTSAFAGRPPSRSYPDRPLAYLDMSRGRPLRPGTASNRKEA
jgi:catechol 2,3-dioxygenase-like lactoylglutathione lyase family enzyme